ncbi:hypothetical protein HMPREF9455_04025 [Dysgonomonas gadei ATCC BAA-286]|uniref:Uncharacterized protein n=1 Tax=Dysgonomonas gadei ATCC BAA-286 TaxID=742766 RepID=F5J3V8_9BACT|nr:hypothetical protein HMPREF9455_04025 [Dysgonomonas gadei ATCC BAA-286]
MKYNLKDIIFLFLVRIDTIKRVENLLTIFSHFETNVPVLEASSYDDGILRRLM